MKKIAVFQYDLGIGGIQKSLINLLNNLDENIEVDLFLNTSENFYNAKFSQNIHIHYLKPLPKYLRFLPISLLLKVQYFKSEKNYDVAIDFNSYKPECAIGALQAKAIKRVSWCHNDVQIKAKEELKYRVIWGLSKYKYKKFDYICAVSKGVKNSIAEKTNFSRENIIVIPNLIDANEILEKSNEKIQLNVDSTKFNLVFVGRLVHQKGLDLLFPILQKVFEQRSDMSFYIIGDGSEKEKLILMAEELGISDHIYFLGAQKNPFSYLKQMDGFILTSRYEGQGIVLLEAKVLGLQLFMAKRLEQYIEDIAGVEDFYSTLLNAKKIEKRTDTLEEYNKKVLHSFNQLIAMEDN